MTQLAVLSQLLAPTPINLVVGQMITGDMLVSFPSL
jgi:hypothetical protein